MKPESAARAAGTETRIVLRSRSFERAPRGDR
jgi:hypothetical protein